MKRKDLELKIIPLSEEPWVIPHKPIVLSDNIGHYYSTATTASFAFNVVAGPFLDWGGEYRLSIRGTRLVRKGQILGWHEWAEGDEW